MNIHQLIKIAQKDATSIPSKQTKFTFKNPFGVEFEGEFLDAFFELIRIPSIGEGFLRISQLTQLFGDDLEFTIIE